MPTPEEVDRETIIGIAAGRNKLDHATSEIVAALTEAEIRCAVLKGVTIEKLIYGEGEVRSQLDVDVLVPPDAEQEAWSVLAGLGFSQSESNSQARSVASRRHSYKGGRPGGPVVDVHTGLLGCRVSHEDAFALLSEHFDTLDLGWTTLPCLDRPARAMHMVLHAAQHLGDYDRTGIELERAMDVLPSDVWKEAFSLAKKLDATAAMAFGLRQSAAGRQLADSLGLTSQVDAETLLIAYGHPPKGAVVLERLLRVPGFWAKLQLVREELSAKRGVRGDNGAMGSPVRRVLETTRTVFTAAAAVLRARRAARQSAHRGRLEGS